MGKSIKGLFENITWVIEELESRLTILAGRWEIRREAVQEPSPNLFYYYYYYFSNKNMMVLESVLDKHGINNLNSVI